MEDIAEELARRDRFLRHRALAMTPEQRMAEMQRLQEQARTVHPMSAEGYKRFIARNYKQRAIDVPHKDAT